MCRGFLRAVRSKLGDPQHRSTPHHAREEKEGAPQGRSSLRVFDFKKDRCGFLKKYNVKSHVRHQKSNFFAVEDVS